MIWRDTEKSIRRDIVTGAEVVEWFELDTRRGVAAADFGFHATANAATNTAALTSALTYAARARTHVILPGGRFNVGNIRLPGVCRIVGGGAKRTILHYEGTGTAITTATPDARTYGIHLARFAVTGAGACGIDMDSMSSASVSDMEVSGFDVGIHLRSKVGGGCTYNRVRDVSVARCGTGYRLDYGANATVMHGCRANVCTTCWELSDCNDNTISASQAESSGTAFRISASLPGSSDWNRITDCRVEYCAVGFDITSSNVRDLVIRSPWIDPSTTVRYRGAGARTHRAEALVNVGEGPPDGVIAAPVGSLYLRTDGGEGTTLYVKESGAGQSGWVAK